MQCKVSCYKRLKKKQKFFNNQLLLYSAEIFFRFPAGLIPKGILGESQKPLILT